MAQTGKTARQAYAEQVAQEAERKLDAATRPTTPKDAGAVTPATAPSK